MFLFVTVFVATPDKIIGASSAEGSAFNAIAKSTQQISVLAHGAN